jgi:isoquinoline 1-oxidoreductase alpha subunit
MTSAKLSVNGTEYPLPEVDGVTLQFARDDLGLREQNSGGMSQCGAALGLVDGKPTSYPVSSVLDKQITTIEGLGKRRFARCSELDRRRRAVGWCQSGQLISAAALLDSNPRPTEAEIRQAMNFHLCRCGTYNRIVQAIQLAAMRMGEPA